MSFFSSNLFLEAAGEAFFAGRRYRQENVEVEGKTYRVLVAGRRRVATRLPFLDFLEPLPPGEDPTRRVGFLPRVAVERVPVEVWHQERRDRRQLPSPYIDWARFSSWDAFVEHFRPRLSVDIARKRRKLGREVGPVRFERHMPERSLLSTLMEWKSGQYRANGLPDVFRDACVRRLFELLLDKGALELSALFAGERPVALHAGVVWEGRFLYWLPAYDPELPKTSPGTLHLIDMMRRSFEEGQSAFDLLLGDEAYKWIYATDVTCVGSVGRPPLPARLYGGVRGRVIEQVRRQRRVYGALQAAKRQVIERGWLR